MRKWKLAILAAVVYGCTVFGGPQVYGMGSNKPKNPVGNQGVCGEGCLSKKKDQEEEAPTVAASPPPSIPDSATVQEVAREAITAITSLWRRVEEAVDTINAELQLLKNCPNAQIPVDPTAFIESLLPAYDTIDRANTALLNLMEWQVQECKTTTCLPYTWAADNFVLNYQRRFPSIPFPQTPPTIQEIPLGELSPILSQSLAHILADFEDEFSQIEGMHHMFPLAFTPEYVVSPATFVESIRVLDELASALEAMILTVADLIVEHCPELAPAIAGEDCTQFCEQEILSFCSETTRDTTDADTDGTVTPNLETDCLFCGPRAVAIGCASQITRPGCGLWGLFGCKINYGLGGSADIGGD